eukprot:g4929.t1
MDGGTRAEMAFLEASKETPESAYVKEETSASAEQREHEVIIAQLKRRLKDKVKHCTALQEELRSLEAKITVLRTEKSSEMQQQRQFAKDLAEEKLKIMEVRKQFTRKGKDHVRHLKKVHELDTKSKALLFQEQTLDQSIRHSKEITRATEDKVREMQRDLHGLKLKLDASTREMQNTKEIVLELRSKLQKKEFDMIRENYASRVQIEELKRIVDEREDIVRNLEVDRTVATDEIQRISIVIENIREEAAHVSEVLRKQVKDETFRVEDLERALSTCRINLKETREALEVALESEAVMKKDIATSKELNFALHASASEAKANVNLAHSRAKDEARENATLIQTLADLDADNVLLQEKLKNTVAVRDQAKITLAQEKAHVKKLMEELREEIDLDNAHGGALEKAKAFAIETEKKMGEMAAEETNAQARVVTLNTELELLKSDIAVVRGGFPDKKRAIEEKLVEGELLAKSMQEKKQERAYKREQFEKRKSELERELSDKDATIERLRRAVTLTDARNESMKSMMVQTSQMLREDREKLEKNIVDARANDASLVGKLHDAEEQEYEAELAIGGVQEKESVLESKLSAAKKELKPLVAEFDTLSVELKTRMKEETRKAYDLEETLDRVTAEIHSTVLKFDEEVAQETILLKALRAQQIRSAAAKDNFEFQRDIEREYEERISGVEKLLKVSEVELTSSTEVCARLLSDIEQSDNITEFQEKQIRDEEASQAEMLTLLTKERSLVQEIDRIIKVKQGQFESDSNAVAERLLAYQNMLVDRSETANRISGHIRGELESQRLLSAKVQEVKELMEAELIDYHSRMKSVLAENDECKIDISDKEVSIMEIKAEIQRATEAVSDIRIKLDSKLNERDAMKDEIDLCKREARQLRLQLETRGAYEKELFDTLKMKDQTIELLERQMEDADGVDKTLREQILSTTHEKKMVLEQISSRKAVEDALVEELEATKMEFSGVSGVEDANLQESMHRSDAHRAEYASTLLRVVEGEGE